MINYRIGPTSARIFALAKHCADVCFLLFIA